MSSEHLIAWLGSNGFDIDNIESRAFNGNTPLLYAALEGELQVIEDLLLKGADLYAVNHDHNGVLFNACYADRPDIIETVVAKGADVDDTNEEGTTPLMYAASAGRTACVKTLLDFGSDKEMINEDGFKAIDFAANRQILSLLRNA